MKIGSHVTNNGKLMLEGSIKEALSYDANCFMVYLGAPQNTFRRPLSEMNSEKMKEIAIDNGIDLFDCIIHAPYIVNVARVEQQKHQFAVDFLTQEVRGVHQIGAKYMVLHPGSATDGTREEAIMQIIKGINQIIFNTKECRTVILIETMAGKGNEMGRTFEEVKSIIDGIDDKSRIGVCLDTCHINDAGYDIVNNYEGVITEFDNVIGLDYLKCIHLNDSKNPLASHKDRHENIGLGKIGFDTLMKFVKDVRLLDIPHILETPYVLSDNHKESYPPYKEEIKMIKSGIFDPNLLTNIKNNYQN